MEILRFAHRFFHFNQCGWIRATSGREADWNFARRLFQDGLLPRRQLKRGEISTFDEARKTHEQHLRIEEDLGIRAITEASPCFPDALARYIPPERRPVLLYLRGAAIPDESRLIGVVGTRGPSQAGREAAHSFSASS